MTGEALNVTVVQVLREYGLRVLGGSEGGVDSTTVVIRVPSRRRVSIKPEDSASEIPFNAQDLQLLAKRVLKPCVPDITGLPICRSNGRTDEVVLVGYPGEGRDGIDHRLEVVDIVLRSVGRWTMPMCGVEIRFVPYLETN